MFKDKEVLEHLYSATDQLMSQLYMNLLEVLLANSLKDVPVFSKEYWKLLTFNSSHVIIEGTEYRFPLVDKIRGMRFMYNRIFEPSIILESQMDYRVSGDYIYFSKNIFDDLEFPGLAKRYEGSSIIISMWVPEADVDKEYIYEYYGRLLQIYEPSSDSYKAFIRGVWFYFMNGPTVNRITSALNIIGGFPVATEENEVVLSIRISNGIQFVKTTVTTYEIKEGINLMIAVGEVLSPFQHLTDAYTVTDYMDNPSWFDNIVVPIEVIPNLSAYERTTNRHDPNVIPIGYPILIGNPEWYIGLGGLPNFMWLLFNQILKYNIFYVRYDAQATKFLRSVEDLQNIVLDGKPGYVLAITEPYTTLMDSTGLSDIPMMFEPSLFWTEVYENSDMDEELLFEFASEYSDTNTIPSESVLFFPDMSLSDTGEATEQALWFDIEHVFSDLCDLASTIDQMFIDFDLNVDDTYGQIPVVFGQLPTLIGLGVLGGTVARFESGVPALIGTNNIGNLNDGLYAETPVVIEIS
jgi:hypothetical protein